MGVSYIITRKTDIKRGIRRDNIGQLLAYADSEAQTFNVEVVDDGEAADLTGYTALGYFNRPQGDTVVIPGTIEDNIVTVVLPEACYAQTGRFDFIIRLTDGESSKVVVYWGDGAVRVSQSDVIIDPGDVVPSLETLLAKLDQMDAAAEAANTAAENATAAASSSVRYDTVQTLTAAQKAQAQSNLGLALDDTLTQAGEAADAKATGDEISDLKSAINASDILETLRADEIPGTTQTIAFDSQTGDVSQITHTNSSSVAVRTDVFTFGAGTITEIRTLNTGESLTIVTNTTTLATTVTYAAA